MLWKKHGDALRSPKEIFGTKFADAGIVAESLEFDASPSFTALLKKFGITLLVSREYENLVLALSEKRGVLRQSFFHLPHPSGIAVDNKTGSVYVAATRNPNQIVEFRPINKRLVREGIKHAPQGNFLIPTRAKYYPGAYYFHDLAFIGGKLYANSVGQNGIIRIDMNLAQPEGLLWWPKCVERNGRPDTKANYIQLNSIAAGKTIKDSFFSASGDQIRPTRPGDQKYPVDKEGVIFSGKNRKAIARGLTRPHSARFYGKKLLVDNSGYGEIGYIEKGIFHAIMKLPGWTRGLYIIGDVAFVGVSRILPRFKHYAPGLKGVSERSGIFAIDLKKEKIIGSIEFPYGNQIFAVEGIKRTLTEGFLYHTIDDTQEEKDSFFTSLV